VSQLTHMDGRNFKTATRSLLLAGLGLILAYGLAVLVLAVHTPADFDQWFRPAPRIPFSKAQWDSSHFGDVQRYKLANGLVSSAMLIGKTEAEARDLLGEPSSEDRVNGEVLLGYDLIAQTRFPARCRFLPSFLFFNTDTWLLEVRCAEGRVQTVKIRST
jgi:hypothetical protein